MVSEYIDILALLISPCIEEIPNLDSIPQVTPGAVVMIHINKRWRVIVSTLTQYDKERWPIGSLYTGSDIKKEVVTLKQLFP